MKKHIYSVVILLTLLVTLLAIGTVSAEEAKVKVISTIPAKTSDVYIGSDTEVLVIQIEDQKNGVVCYGLITTSKVGRSDDGGFPGVAMSCESVHK